MDRPIVNDELIYSLVLGVMASCLLLAVLLRDGQSVNTRRAIGMAAFAMGVGLTLWLQNNPDEVNRVMEETSLKAIGIVGAALAAATLLWKASLFRR